MPLRLCNMMRNSLVGDAGAFALNRLLFATMERDAMGTHIETRRIEKSMDSLSEYSELVAGVAARVTALQGELQGVLQIHTKEDPNY